MDRRGIPGLAFRKTVTRSVRLLPGDGGRPTEVPIEIRWDPVTGRTTHVSHVGAIRPLGPDPARYAEPEVVGFCPFCPPNRDRVTPRFPQELIPGGRLERGEALLVPNLYPYDVHSTVCILTEAHVVPPARLSAARVLDGLLLGVEAWRTLSAADPANPFPVMGWNAMPPSGGGLVHPHQQYLLTRHPGNRYRAELQASREYAAASGTPIWKALVEEERRRGERFLGTTGPWSWLSAFAPRGVLGEIVAVLEAPAGLGGLTAPVLEALAKGLRSVFEWMSEQGIPAFNASLFVAPAGEEHFATHLSLVPRTFLNLRDMAGDVNFLQMLFEEPVTVVSPEEIARTLAPQLSRKPS